jgi:hypothetical protein
VALKLVLDQLAQLIECKPLHEYAPGALEKFRRNMIRVVSAQQPRVPARTEPRVRRHWREVRRVRP